MRAYLSSSFLCSADCIAAARIISAFVRVRVEPASLLQPICYKQEMEALFLVWYSGYDVFDTFSMTNLPGSQTHLLRNQTFHSFL